MNKHGITLTTERYGGVEGGVRFNVTAFRDVANDHPELGVLNVGGLGDIRSSSLFPLAKKTIGESDGELISGNVRTERPLSPIDSIQAAVDAREQRALSAGGAILGFFDKFENTEHLLVVGQSQGGVSIIDGLIRATDKEPSLSEKVSGLTVDTPGIDGPVDTSIAPGLVKLGLHCAPDLWRMGLKQRTKMVWDMVKRGYSPNEAIFLLGEIMYLSTIDLRPETEELDDRNVNLSHASHSLDVVPGAEFPNDRRVVFEGGHLHTLYGQGADEMAKHIVGLVRRKGQLPDPSLQLAA